MKHLASLSLLGVLLLAGCSREPRIGLSDSAPAGGVQIALSQDARGRLVGTKAEGTLEEAELPPVDDFEVEIYNA